MKTQSEEMSWNEFQRFAKNLTEGDLGSGVGFGDRWVAKAALNRIDALNYFTGGGITWMRSFAYRKYKRDRV